MKQRDKIRGQVLSGSIYSQFPFLFSHYYFTADTKAGPELKNAAARERRPGQKIT
jgi:hypothetical protein